MCVIEDAALQPVMRSFSGCLFPFDKAHPCLLVVHVVIALLESSSTWLSVVRLHVTVWVCRCQGPVHLVHRRPVIRLTCARPPVTLRY